MNLTEMYALKARAYESAKNILTTNTLSDGTISADGQAAYDKAIKDFENICANIKQYEQMESIQNAMAQPTSAPLFSGIKPTVNEDDYAKRFMNSLRTGFTVINQMVEGTNADGGYLVPSEMHNAIVEKATAENIMRQLGTVITTSAPHKIPVEDSVATAAWVAEGGNITFGKDTFGNKGLDAHKLVTGIKVSNELLADSAFNLEQYVANKAGIAIANAEENAFLNGNGTGKPTGIFDSTNGGTFLTALTAAIKADDIFDLIYALPRAYRKNASFVMSDDIVKQIRKLKDTTGQFIWQPSYAAGEPDTLAGYKLMTSVSAPQKHMAFGDMAYYTIGDRSGITIQRLGELFAANDMTGFKISKRVDGILTIKEAVQVLPLKQD